MTADEKFIMRQPITYFVKGTTKIPPNIQKGLQKAIKNNKKSMTINGHEVGIKLVDKEWIENSRRLCALYKDVLANPTKYKVEVFFRVKFADYSKNFPNLTKLAISTEENYKKIAEYFFDCGTVWGNSFYKKLEQVILSEKKKYINYCKCQRWVKQNNGLWKCYKRKVIFSDFNSYYNNAEPMYEDWYLSAWRKRYDKKPSTIEKHLYRDLEWIFYCGTALGIKRNIDNHKKTSK